MSKLTTKQAQRLYDKVLYTNLAIESAMDAIGLSAKKAADVLAAEQAVEKLGLSVCVRCGFWRDTSLMDADGVCEPCWESDNGD